MGGNAVAIESKAAWEAALAEAKAAGKAVCLLLGFLMAKCARLCVFARGVAVGGCVFGRRACSLN